MSEIEFAENRDCATLRLEVTMIRTIETKVEVTADRHLTVMVPRDVTPGEHDVVVVIEDAGSTVGSQATALPVLHVGAWNEDATLRREEIYGQDGR